MAPTDGVAACPPDAELVKHVEGRLDGAARARLEEHVAGCSACGAVLAGLAAEGGKGARSAADDARWARSVVAGETLDPLLPNGASPAILGRGTPVGRYIVLSLLGRGGMGEVYAAYDPELDRRVALKILHTARGADQARQRLVREARALGKLSHPNVVQVHDVGEHEGDVFVAMELVEGQTLGAWRRREPAPPWREVLAAYLDAARGLAAAHEKGLVHRDVKPSNILRAGDGRVRVVDFGLAAPSDDRSPDEAARSPRPSPPAPDGSGERLTSTGTILGTPRYMAPEQLEGRRAGPASDQYGLCTALYEGLYGEVPFTTGPDVDLDEMLARKREGSLTVPAGSPVPAWIHERLARGLAPRQEDRYPSLPALIDALGDDPDARRRVRRLRAGIGGAAATLLAIAALGWVRSGVFEDPCAHPERQLAGVWDDGVKARVKAAFTGTPRPYAEDTLTRVSGKLDRYAAGWSTMRGEVCEASRRQRQRREILDLRDQCLDRGVGQLQALTTLLAEGPDVQVLDKAVQAADALAPVASCADVERLTARVRPPEDPALRAQVAALQPRIDRLEALHTAGKYQDALALGEPLLVETQALSYAPARAQVQYWVGRLRAVTGDRESGKALLREATVSAADGRDDVLAAITMARLLYITGEEQRRLEEAEMIAALGRPVVVRARDDLAQATWLNAAGLLLWRTGKATEARAAFERTIAIYERIPSRPDLSFASTVNNLGFVHEEAGDYAPAMAAYERALAIRERALGPDHPLVAQSLGNMVSLVTSLGDYPRAVSLAERAVAVTERSLGPESLDFAARLESMTTALLRMGECSRALANAERTLAIRQKALGPENVAVAAALQTVGSTLFCMGDYRRALAVDERALAIQEKVLGPDHLDVALTLVNTGDVLIALGEHPRALAADARALAIEEKRLGPEHVALADASAGMARAQLRLGRTDAAEGSIERVRALREKLQGSSRPEFAEPLLLLGQLHLARREADRALPLLERALALDLAELRPEVQLTLADALWESGKDRPRARTLAEQARAHYERLGHRPGLERATRFLAEHR